MKVSNHQKFILQVKGADLISFNGRRISLGDYINSFAEIMSEKGFPISYRITSKYVHCITLETDNFPAGIIIALFASPLKMIGVCNIPSFFVGNKDYAFTNNRNIKFFIPAFHAVFSSMQEIERFISQKGMEKMNTEVVQVRHLNPKEMPIELPQCHIGNPGIYNGGSVVIDSVVNAHLSDYIIKIEEPVDEAFYNTVWESLKEIYS